MEQAEQVEAVGRRRLLSLPMEPPLLMEATCSSRWDTAKVEEWCHRLPPSLRRKDLADLHENKCCTGTLATGFGISEAIKVTTLDKYVASEEPSSVQIKAGDERSWSPLPAARLRRGGERPH